MPLLRRKSTYPSCSVFPSHLYLRNVLAHAEDEYGIDPKPVLIIGLGHGGSLVWQIACNAPNLARLLAPVDGAYSRWVGVGSIYRR
jgi:polyhydroxybutyrate depolymerase